MTKSTTDDFDELDPTLLELGKALFVCQAFEGTLVFLLSLISHEQIDGEHGAFQAAVDLYSQKTLGQLLKGLAKEIDLPDEVQSYLSIGWDRRNAIVHRFLHENVASFADSRARGEIETLLVAHKHEVKLADVVANKLLDLYLAKYGVEVSDLKRNADLLWRYMNPAPPSGPSSKH